MHPLVFASYNIGEFWFVIPEYQVSPPEPNGQAANARAASGTVSLPSVNGVPVYARVENGRANLVLPGAVVNELISGADAKFSHRCNSFRLFIKRKQGGANASCKLQ